jgi:hypothetical protein
MLVISIHFIYRPPNDGIVLSPCLPPVMQPLSTTLHHVCMFLVGCCMNNHRSTAVKGHCMIYFDFLRCSICLLKRGEYAPPPIRLTA